MIKDGLTISDSFALLFLIHAINSFFSKKISIDGVNLPDSRLVELLDRCAISVKGIEENTKKQKQDGKKSK